MPRAMGKVDETERFRRGVMLALLVERRLNDSAELAWYDVDSEAQAMPLDLAQYRAESEATTDDSLCFSLAGEGAFALDELERSPRYAGHIVPKAPWYRFLYRLYADACAKHHSGLALVELKDGHPSREVRLPGCPHLLLFANSGDVVEQGFASEELRELVEGYIGDTSADPVGLFADFDGETPNFDHTLFLCRAILSTWTNKREDVVSFVNSSTFETVVKAVWDARRGAFSDDEFPLAATGYLLQHRLGLSTNDQIEEASKQLYLFLHKKTKDAIELYREPLEERHSCPGLASYSSRITTNTLMATGHPRDFIRLWQYESLDCRAAWWVEREARRLFVEEHSQEDTPMINMAFRLLSRVAENVSDRKIAFDTLNDLDLANQAKSQFKSGSFSSIVGVRGLMSLLEDLDEIDDKGWVEHPRSAWLTGRDQTVRCCVIGAQLRNRLDGNPLTFSYAAYDLHDGVAQMCWSHAGQLFEDRSMARNLVDELIEQRDMGLADDHNRQRFIGQGLKVNLDDGCLVAAHTVRRAFTLEIRGADRNRVDRVMRRILMAADITAHSVSA